MSTDPSLSGNDPNLPQGMTPFTCRDDGVLVPTPENQAYLAERDASLTISDFKPIFPLILWPKVPREQSAPIVALEQGERISITFEGRTIVKSIPEWHRGALERIGGPGYGEKRSDKFTVEGAHAAHKLLAANPPASPPPSTAPCLLTCDWCGGPSARHAEGDDLICEQCAFPKAPGIWIFVSGIIAGAALCEAVNLMLRSFNL